MTCSKCGKEHTEGRSYGTGNLCPVCVDLFKQYQASSQEAFDALPEEDRISNLQPLTVSEWVENGLL